MISLVFWAITMVVSVKYVTFIMRADNDGEGGIMALTALLQARAASSRRAAYQLALITLGILGASLFYGDGVITPAISVLSAVEGLKVAVPEPALARAADHGRGPRPCCSRSSASAPSSSATCSGR